MKPQKLFTLLAAIACSGSAYASDLEKDKILWKNAYEGNFSIVHKLALTREGKNLNDELLNQFVMAYSYYRMGNFEEVEAIFKGIDCYLEHAFSFKDE